MNLVKYICDMQRGSGLIREDPRLSIRRIPLSKLFPGLGSKESVIFMGFLKAKLKGKFYEKKIKNWILNFFGGGSVFIF